MNELIYFTSKKLGFLFIIMIGLNVFSQENWSGYEGGNKHNNSSNIDVNISDIGVAWKREFKDPLELPNYWSFSSLNGNLGSRNICLMNGKIAIVADELNIGASSVTQNRQGYISIIDANNGKTLNILLAYISDGPRHLSNDYPKIFWDAHDNARGFTVLQWDAESDNLFIMNGGDGNMCTAYKPLDNILTFKQGVTQAGIPAFTNFPRTDRQDYEWNRTFPNISSFIECSPNTPTLAHISSTSHNMAVNSWSLQFINKYTGYKAHTNFVNEYLPINNPPYIGTIPIELRPFSMWGALMTDNDVVYLMGPGDDIDTSGILGDNVLIGSLSNNKIPDQGLYIWAYNINWFNKEDQGYNDSINELDSINLDTAFCYRFSSKHIPVDGYMDAESYLELDGFYRNKSWLIDDGAVWATWKPDKASNTELIYCDKDSSATFDLGVGAGMKGQDTWPHISLANISGEKYIVYYAGNAFDVQYNDSYNTYAGASQYDVNEIGNAELSVFKVSDNSVKWTYNLSNNEPSLIPNLSLLYFDKSLLVVAGKYAVMAWVDLSDNEAKLQLLSFDISSETAVPIHQSINLGFSSTDNSKSVITDLAAANGELYALITQSDTLCPMNQTFTAQYLYALSSNPDTILPVTGNVFCNIVNSPDYAYLTWDKASDNNWVVAYNIYSNGELIKYTKDTNLITLLVKDQKYTFTLEAIDAAGNKSLQDTLEFVAGETLNDIDYLQIKNDDILIYPNPTSHFIKVNSENYIEEYKIYSLSGSYILGKNNLSSKELNINLNKLKKGLYIIQLFENQNYYSKVIIIE